jgi:hypothetical protein
MDLPNLGDPEALRAGLPSGCARVGFWWKGVMAVIACCTSGNAPPDLVPTGCPAGSVMGMSFAHRIGAPGTKPACGIAYCNSARPYLCKTSEMGDAGWHLGLAPQAGPVNSLARGPREHVVLAIASCYASADQPLNNPSIRSSLVSSKRA